MRNLLPIALAALVPLTLFGCSTEPRPSAEPVSPQSGWTRRAPASLALTEVAVATDGRVVFMAGGLTADGQATTSVTTFDPRSDIWRTAPELPEPIHHSTLVMVDGALWIVGGFDAGGQPTAAVRSSQGNNWRDEAPLPAARGAGAAAWDGDRLVYAGGVGPGGVTSDVLVLEDGAWRRLGNMAEGREHLAAASDGAGAVYLLGGRQGGLDGNRATVEVVVGDQIRNLGQLPTPRGGVAAFWWPSLGACLVGGESPGGTNPQVECMAPDGTLTSLPNLGEARHGLGAAVVDGVVYVISGGTEPGLFVSDTVEALTLP